MHIFITGGTRGIGNGLVREFLRLGHEVSFTGTNESSITNASKNLKGDFCGIICDVRSYDSITKAKDTAVDKYKCIDIWINNAGVSQDTKDVCDLSEDDIKKVIDINVSGMIMGTSVAITEMKRQNFGFIYNMEGLGSNNMKIAKTVVYGSSKRLLTYFSKACNKELKEYKNITVGTLSPGMVFTDLLLADLEQESLKITAILGNKVETVTPFLVNKMIKEKKYIHWLTNRKIAWKFFRSMFKRNKVKSIEDLKI